jgi:hypothetical protein
VSIAVFQPSGAEHISNNPQEYQPNLERQFMIGSTVVALVGPSAVGRQHIISTAAELFPDEITPLTVPLEASDDQKIQIVGLVAEAPLWFNRFANRYPAGTPERPEQRDEALECIKWLGQHANDIPLLYNFNGHEDITATELHDYLCGYTSSFHEGRRTLPNLRIAAETIGD